MVRTQRGAVTRVGPFELEEFLARGGMGSVWRGRHHRSGRSVAIKLISEAHRARADFLSAFHQEAEAVARLHHEGIVSIYDYGEVPEGADPSSSLRPGTPFLVMECVQGRALLEWPRPMPWGELRGLLCRLLDALAYAHARGVIHRDLKPGNILARQGEGGGWDELKLIDFGIAAIQAIDERHVRSGRGGTPRYMAPEQLLAARAREEGPWTDIFALGCLAHELLTGQAPGEQLTVDELIHRRAAGEPELLGPCPGAPDGFTEWLETALASDPADRFEFAADALWALEQLARGAPEPADASRPPADPQGPSSRQAPTSRSLWTLAPLSTLGHLDLAGSEPSTAELEFGAEALRPEPPPMPPRWRSAGPRRAPMHGAGLGLYGLRTVPLIGRQRERDQLWGALARVHQTRRPHVVHVRGDAGVGKSRLAAWLCHRAHEVGAALSWAALHDETRRAELVEVVRQVLGCQDMSAPQARQQLERVLARQGVVDPLERAELEALLELGDDEAPPKPVGQRQRLALAVRALERASRGRPVILWLDDAHLSEQSRALAQHLLELRERGEGPALLVVMTSREEALIRDPHARDELDALPERGAEELALGALSRTQQRELLGALLGLDDQLIDRVLARAEGNPLFATQLVGDWVTRQILIPGPEGFELREGAEVPPPRDLRALCMTRVEGVVSTTPPSQRRALLEALEIAATLGRHITARGWRAACDQAAVTAPTSPQIEALCQHGVLARQGSRLTFTHGMLREALRARATEHDRLPRWHRACARALRAQGLGAHLERDTRWLRHQLHGEDLTGCGAHLGRILNALPPGQLERFRELIEQALERVEGAERDEFAFQYHSACAHQLLQQHDSERVADLIEELEALAPRLDPTRAHLWRARIEGTRSWLALHERRYEDGLEAAQRAEDALGQDPDAGPERFDIGRVRVNLLCFMCRPAEALAVIERLDQDPAIEPMPWDRAWMTYERAMVLNDMERPAACAEALEEAMAEMEALGDPIGVASCLNVRGDMRYEAGRLEDALADFTTAREHFQRAGDLESLWLMDENIGRTALKLRRWRLALRTLEPIAQEFERGDQDNLYVNCVHDAMMAASAALGAWSRWDHHAAQLEALFEHSCEFIDEIIAEGLEIATAEARRAQDMTRTARAEAMLARALVLCERDPALAPANA